MKIAVLSDVHGNVPALEAVLDDVQRWGADRLVVNGDVISRGPCSEEVLALLARQAPGCQLLTGNHETFVLACHDHPPHPTDWDYDLKRFASWTAERLGKRLDEVRRWADHVDLPGLEGGASMHVTHGSRLGNRDGIKPETPDADLPDKLGDSRALFVGSHTHRPLVRRFNATLVVNTGSVGQPFDGDPRAAYGRFTYAQGGWRAAIARVPYDKQRAVRDFSDSGFLDQCGPVAQLISIEHQQNRMHVGRLMGRYLQPIRAGEITVAQAVAAYLEGME